MPITEESWRVSDYLYARLEEMEVNILGVKVDDLPADLATDTVLNWLQKKGEKHYLVTPNPEFIIRAQEDEAFRQILNQADLAIPDGIGLKWFGGVKNIIGGVYFIEKLCQKVSKHDLTVGFLGGRGGVAKKAAEYLKRKYFGLKVGLAEDGPEVDGRWKIEDKKWKIDQSSVNIPPTDLLFVAFGQVKQEKWIANNLDKLPVKVAMGVGGSFDEIAGKVPKVPDWIHQIGLKWLVRLILQPWRAKRQLALVKFVWLMIYGRVKL